MSIFFNILMAPFLMMYLQIWSFGVEIAQIRDIKEVSNGIFRFYGTLRCSVLGIFGCMFADVRDGIFHISSTSRSENCFTHVSFHLDKSMVNGIVGDS